MAANLERSFPLLRVRGEIAQLTRAASGHWYFSLRDSAASVRAVMFRGKTALLDWQPKEGDQVEVTTVVTLYEPRGDFQLRVESMVRSGQGALFEAFLARKEKLAKAGLLDDSRKKPLPTAINAIAVVTSLGAAALRDVVVTMTQSAPRIRLRLYPSLVQGADAPAMLSAQLGRADQDPEIDVILLVRGGGSLEDLWAFNDEDLAMAIARCRHPVIVGVGHETDVTIADLVADYRAATPTAAAQRIAAPDMVARQRIAELARLRHLAMRRRWESAQQQLDLLTQRLRSPAERTRERQSRLEKFQFAMQSAMQARLAKTRSILDTRGAQLAALDPTAILQRGYAMVLDAQASVVTDAAKVTTDQALTVQLSKGLLDVRVQKRHLQSDAG